MSKFNLSAAAYASTTSGSAILVLSITDEFGVPVTSAKKSWVSVSNLVFATKDYGLVKLLIQDFYQEPNGVYTMTLKPDPKARLSSAPFKGAPLAISVRKISLALLGTGSTGVLAEGYLVIPNS